MVWASWHWAPDLPQRWPSCISALSVYVLFCKMRTVIRATWDGTDDIKCLVHFLVHPNDADRVPSCPPVTLTTRKFLEYTEVVAASGLPLLCSSEAPWSPVIRSALLLNGPFSGSSFPVSPPRIARIVLFPHLVSFLIFVRSSHGRIDIDFHSAPLAHKKEVHAGWDIVLCIHGSVLRA